MTHILPQSSDVVARHQEEWAASCIPQPIIDRNFLTYLDSRDVDELLNFNSSKKWKHSDHLVPGWGVSGVDPQSGERWLQGAQYKPDHPLRDPKTGKTRKYFSPYRQSLSPLFLEVEDSQYWPKLIKDVGQPVIVTEGAKKAGAVLGQGYPCISLPGVATGGKQARLRKSLSLFCRYGRSIYLAFDSDIVTKPQVARALHNLGRMIAEKGAMVYVLEWPTACKGIDDLIASGESLSPLIEKAKTLEEWRDSLSETEEWQTAEKCKLALQYERVEGKLKDRIRWNALRSHIEIDGEVCDSTQLRLELALRFNIPVSSLDCDSILLHLARQHQYHPVREYLQLCAETYDPDSELLESLATDYLGVDSELHRTYLRKTLISAVARALDPGCKVDTVCILQGLQGARKSTFWKILASPEWFDDSFGSASDKDERLKLHQCWFVEWAELESVFKRKDVSSVKAFLTTSTDAICPPYGKVVEQMKRPSIIVGSTNFDEFLSDPTGARRFWVIPISIDFHEERPIDTEKLAEDRDRIWAAATHAYVQGEKWTLPAHLIKVAQEENENYALSDPWEEPIKAYISVLPHVTSNEVLSQCLHVDLDKQNKSMQMRVSNLLKQLGWKRRRAKIDGLNLQHWFPPDLTQQVGTVGNNKNIEEEEVDESESQAFPTSFPTSVPTPVPTSEVSVTIDCDDVTDNCDNQPFPTFPTSNPKRPEKVKNTQKTKTDSGKSSVTGVTRKVERWVHHIELNTRVQLIRLCKYNSQVYVPGLGEKSVSNEQLDLDDEAIGIDGQQYKVVARGNRWLHVVKGERGRKKYAYSLETGALTPIKDKGS